MLDLFFSKYYWKEIFKQLYWAKIFCMQAYKQKLFLVLYLLCKYPHNIYSIWHTSREHVHFLSAGRPILVAVAFSGFFMGKT